MGRRRRSFAILVGLVAALTVASSAAAASPWISIRQNGVSAVAQRLDCTDDGDSLSCEAELLAAFKGTLKITGSPTTHTDLVCYEHLRATLDADTGDIVEATSVGGCAVDTGRVRVRSLGSIVLGSTVVELVRLTCDEVDCTEQPAGQVTVRGSWSSAGRPLVSRLKFRLDEGICTDVLAAQARVREARFRGSVDGAAMHSDLALVGAGTIRITSRCVGGLN